jgi:hypothetical protein
MSSRYGSLVLVARLSESSGPLEPVVTSFSLAGFAAGEPVVTSLAGFALRRPQPPGARMAIPAAFK